MTPDSHMTLSTAVVLLSHHPDGGAFVTNVAKEVAVAGAELADLARLGLLAIDGDRLRLLAPAPTGIWWSDAVLGLLAGRKKPMNAYSLQIKRAKHGAFDQHRQASVGYGLITVQRGRRLGIFGYTRYVPEPHTQAAVLGWLRQVLRSERPVDVWTAQLAAILHHTGLGARWLHERCERKMLKRIANGEIAGVDWAPLVAATGVLVQQAVQASSGAGAAAGAAAAGAVVAT